MQLGNLVDWLLTGEEKETADNRIPYALTTTSDVLCDSLSILDGYT